MQLNGRPAALEIGLYQGELKHFYQDWKDYYYLPAEDTAVHKSIGQFTDRAARQKATPATAYTKKAGSFLPVFCDPPAGLPLFQAEYDARPYYLFTGSLNGLDPGFSASYICGFLSSHLI